MNFRLKSPLYAQLELTENCNNFCNYCYNPWRKDRRPSDENYSVAHFQKVIKELIENEVFQLTITGGEPMLRKDMLFEVITYAVSGDIEVSLNSNLTLIDTDTAKRLRSVGVKSVLGSLVSHDRETHNRISGSDSYDKTIRGIEAIVNEGLPLGINMVVSKQNLTHIYETARLCESLGINHFFATKLNPSPSKLEQVDLSLSLEETKVSLDALLQAKRDFGMKVDVLEPLPHCAFLDQKYLDLLNRTCTAGITWVAISPNGSVRSCTHIETDYGNVIREGLPIIWSRMISWVEEAFVPKECKEDCTEYAFCGGGCRASAQCGGNIRGRDLLMTQPISVEILHRDENKFDLRDDDRFALNGRARYREEYFGITVYVNPKIVAFLNNDSKEFLAVMNSLKVFGIKEIGSYTRENPEPFVRYLLQKGIVIRQ